MTFIAKTDAVFANEMRSPTHMRLAYHDFDTYRKFGVEFEISANLTKPQLGDLLKKFESKRVKPRSVQVTEGSRGWAESQKNDYWHVKYDSTCGPLGKHKDHGWEIASYIGSGLEEICSVAAAAQHLLTHKVETNKNCGLHIHADCRDIEIEQMAAIHSYWMAVEDVIMQSMPKHRKNNIFCKPLCNKFNKKIEQHRRLTSSIFWESIKPTNFGSHDNNDKKVAINSVGYCNFRYANPAYSRTTLELRLPECLLDEQHVKCWAIFYLNFIETAKDRPYLNDYKHKIGDLDYALWALGLAGEKDELLILNDVLFETKVWFLNRIIMHASDPKLAKQAKQKLDFIVRF